MSLRNFGCKGPRLDGTLTADSVPVLKPSSSARPPPKWWHSFAASRSEPTPLNEIKSHPEALASCLALCITAPTHQKAAEAQELAETIAAQMPDDIVAAVMVAVEATLRVAEIGEK